MDIIEIDQLKETFTATFKLQFEYVDPTLITTWQIIKYRKFDGKKTSVATVEGHILGYEPGHFEAQKVVLGKRLVKTVQKEKVIDADDDMEVKYAGYVCVPKKDLLSVSLPEDHNWQNHPALEWTFMNLVVREHQFIFESRHINFFDELGGHVTHEWKIQATFSERLHLKEMPFDRQLLRIQVVGEIPNYMMKFTPLFAKAGNLKNIEVIKEQGEFNRARFDLHIYVERKKFVWPRGTKLKQHLAGPSDERAGKPIESDDREPCRNMQNHADRIKDQMRYVACAHGVAGKHADRLGGGNRKTLDLQDELQALKSWIDGHLRTPLPTFFQTAAGVLPEVLKAASSAVEHWLLQRQMTLERFDSCRELSDTAGDDVMAVNDDEKKEGITFWQKAMALAEKIERDGAFEWTNSARVAFSASLIGKQARAVCPSGVMALKLVRCIGHDNEQKQEEIFSLDKDVEELLQWEEADLSKLLYNAWPIWGLTALLSKQRHHDFLLTVPMLSESGLEDAPLLQVLESGHRPILGGAVLVSAIRLTGEELGVWLARLRRSLQSRHGIDHHVLLVLPRSIESCAPFRWFGPAGPLLHCIWSVDGASLDLDAQSMILYILSRNVPAALLSTAAIPFVGLGDQMLDLLMGAETRDFAMFITDTEVAVGAGELNQRLMIHPPFVDIGFRLFQPAPAAIALMQTAIGVAYHNPFLFADDVLNRFNLSLDMDFLLNASHGFISSEGWFAEDLKQRPQSTLLGNVSDPHLAGGIVLFSMRPFRMMPKWFRGNACREVCQTNLVCPPEALGSACGLMSNDLLLLRTLRDSFSLQHPAARSARPRLLQAGPSSCGTTSIAHFFSDAHGLRVAKNYVEGAEIRDHVRKELRRGTAPFGALDRFDVVVDAFDVVRVGVHFCSDNLGHGGRSCEHVHGDILEENLQEYREILESLHQAYPNLRFIHNSCNLNSWLQKRVYNCWPHLVTIGPGGDWEAFLDLWQTCCNPAFGPGSNVSCFSGEALGKLRMPRRLIKEDFAYPTCCEGMPFYQEAWRGVHQLLPSVIDARRLVPFHIVKDAPVKLSASLGLQMSILDYRTAKMEAKMNTVGFESGGMPKRMQGTKPNNMDSYKSRFETMGLASGGSATFAKSLQSNAQATTQKAIALGEAMGAGGARVPVVPDAGRTMEKMLEKFVNSQLEKHAVAAAERQNKEFKKEEKKKHKKKDKKKEKKKKKKSSSSSSSSSSDSGSEEEKMTETAAEECPKKAKKNDNKEAETSEKS
ncbi:unnamed protein product [Cladocopium goreaui]|uniref:Uncharacterized protein n=1 Tax=Cladocopium goreaui TaxID=2562237 RepID=A0A9P1BZY8_9DINO|nr:unnamed protein product [Cladocopium goreaui]